MNKSSLTLEQIGQAFWGPNWEAPMGAALDVGERTIRRWRADPAGVPDGAWGDLLRVGKARAAEIEAALARLRGPDFPNQVGEMRRPAPRG